MRRKSERGSVYPVFVLASIATTLICTPGPAPAASDLSSAAGHIARRLAADISATPEGVGRVMFVVPPVGLVVTFEQEGARSDREYLLMREPENPGAAFPVVIGTVRLSAVRGETARGILLWSTQTPHPGDRIVPPSRVTIFLLPASDLARHPEASAPLADQALELALSREPKLQVIRLQGKPEPRELAKRLKVTGEIGLLLKPVILPDPGGVRLAAKTRSVLSGHTTASYAEALSLVPRTARPSSPPSTPPSARLSPPPERPVKAEMAERPQKKQAIRTAPAPRVEADNAPPGFVITRKEAEPGEIVPESERSGPIRKEITDVLVAITAADLDGDGQPELVGISEDEVFTYRWTNRGFVPRSGYLEPDKFVRYLSVDAADINGNGRDEIFVTAISSIPAGVELRNRLQSMALELNGRRLMPVVREFPYFLRVARIPGQRRPLLLAQKMGTHEPSKGPILTMAWKGNRYVEEDPLALPGKAAWLYDFAILEVGDEGPTAVTSVNGKGRLLVRRDGKVTWEGKENLGRVEHAGFLQSPRALRFRESLSAVTEPRPKEMAERRVLSRRILAASPLFGGGNVEVVTVANRVHYGLQVRLFGEGAGAASVVGYAGSGEKLEKNWETTPVEGAARDLALADFDGDGRRDVVLLSALEDRASLSLFLLRPGKGARLGAKE